MLEAGGAHLGFSRRRSPGTCNDVGHVEQRRAAVISRHGLVVVAEPVSAVAEAVSVLRPGGRYATMTWGPRESNPWLGLVLDAVGDQFGVPFPPPAVRGLIVIRTTPAD
jgi:hypothetical protein